MSSNTLLIKGRLNLYLWVLMQFSKASNKKSVFFFPPHESLSNNIQTFTSKDSHFLIICPSIWQISMETVTLDQWKNEGLLLKSHIMLPGSYSANKSHFTNLILIDFLQHQWFVHNEMLMIIAMTLQDTYYIIIFIM